MFWVTSEHVQYNPDDLVNMPIEKPAATGNVIT